MSWIPVVDWEQWMAKKHIKLRPATDSTKTEKSESKEETHAEHAHK